MTKDLSKLGVENFHDLIKVICLKPTTNINLNDEILNYFPLRLRKRQK